MCLPARGSVLLLAALALAPANRSAHADQVLFDFSKGFDFGRVPATDVKVTESSGALRIASGHNQQWPGITLAAPNGHWDLSAFEYLALDVKNVGENEATVCCRVDNPGANGVENCNTGSITLKPGEAGVLKVPFRRRPANAAVAKLFGMRGYPGGAQGKGTIDPANVTQLVIFTPKPTADHVWEIDNVRAGGTYTPSVPPEGQPFFPFIDTFGQYIHKEWPGKVHSLAELKQRRDDEAKDLKANPGPEDWDRYGGWKDGPALKATGWFRAEKVDGKWWLVDPEGRLFFSNGIDCVRSLGITPIEERESWFQDFPGDQPELKEFLTQGFSLHGHYAGKTPRCYGFAAANLKRKYGKDWRDASAEIVPRRLRSWGLNTIGNWSDTSVERLRKTPYVATINYRTKMIEGSQGYWGKFPDVFDPEFKAALQKRMAEEKGKSAGDPWCLGYFVDNEMSWGDDTSLAVGALQSPPEQAAKQAFLEDLKAKYGTIGKLNEAWGAKYESWEALAASREAPDKQRAAADLGAFYTRTAEQYFRTVREAVKEVAPNQLYLGCRFAWVNARAVAAAARYCDVVSYNLYRASVADFKLPIAADVPLIIGEFHFGALDRGMFHTGLVAAKDQNDRARMYREYVQGALRHPQFVGCHWFQYQDEPTTGRVYDEENYQIGFVDGCDTPYAETIAASREVGGSMYRLRYGK